ncbi:reverse transcriptase domain-containing protein [Tanacetum coccineum]
MSHGRAGREGPRKCFRLYTESRFEGLDDSTVVDIKRCNLLNIILLLSAVGVDDIIGFDFMEKPDRIIILVVALTNEKKFSDLIGHQMARLPLEPNDTKALILAKQFGCLEEMLIVVSMLSVESIFYVIREKLEEGPRRQRWPKQETLALVKNCMHMDVVIRDSSLKGNQDKRNIPTHGGHATGFHSTVFLMQPQTSPGEKIQQEKNYIEEIAKQGSSNLGSVSRKKILIYNHAEEIVKLPEPSFVHFHLSAIDDKTTEPKKVIIVDDGSYDGTKRVAFDFVRKYKVDNVIVVLLVNNQGKGKVIRKHCKTGKLHSRGKPVMLDSDGATKVDVLAKFENQQMPVYFVSRALRGPKINYTPMEKLVLALLSASRRLKRYFQAHTIIVITDQPIKQLLSNSEITKRMLKWKFKLEGYDIQYRPRISIKGQILADFIMERPKEESPDELMTELEELPEPWTLFTYGSSCIDGSGAGLILTNSEGVEFTYAMRYRFEATNNEAEYEALIAGLWIAKQMGVKNLQANVDS